MTIEAKTHPDNIDIIGKAGTALFLIIKKSIEGKYIIRQRISGIAIHVTNSQQFQNIEGESEPEMIVTVSLSGSPSRTFNFKFSELVLKDEAKTEALKAPENENVDVESNSTSNT